MKITVENLGKIEKATIDINDLTILVGDNNSGKTYLTYSTYGALKNWRDFINYNKLFKVTSKKIACIIRYKLFSTIFSMELLVDKML